MEVPQEPLITTGTATNVADTLLALVIETVQILEVPIQAPPQEENVYPVDGAAVRNTDVPDAYEARHCAPQEIPDGEEVIEPPVVVVVVSV